MPYKGMTNQKVWVSVASGYRLPIPDGCAPDVYALMLRCWAADPHERPEFSTILPFFRPESVNSSTVNGQPTAHQLPKRTSGEKLAVNRGQSNSDAVVAGNARKTSNGNSASSAHLGQAGEGEGEGGGGANAYIDMEKKDGTILRATEDINMCPNQYIDMEKKDGTILRATEDIDICQIQYAQATVARGANPVYDLGSQQQLNQRSSLGTYIDVFGGAEPPPRTVGEDHVYLEPNVKINNNNNARRGQAAAATAATYTMSSGSSAQNREYEMPVANASMHMYELASQMVQGHEYEGAIAAQNSAAYETPSKAYEDVN